MVQRKRPRRRECGEARSSSEGGGVPGLGVGMVETKVVQRDGPRNRPHRVDVFRRSEVSPTYAEAAPPEVVETLHALWRAEVAYQERATTATHDARDAAEDRLFEALDSELAKRRGRR